MTLIQKLLKEIDQEAATTRKFLALVPEDKYSWKPHEKSMLMINLASHIAELCGWIAMGIQTEGLDFATEPYSPKSINNNQELLAYFEENLESGKTVLQQTTEDVLEERWVLRNGETILADYTKYEVIRMALAQTIHHRAQLGVFLRLLNVPIPGSYGPSADELSK